MFFAVGWDGREHFSCLPGQRGVHPGEALGPTGESVEPELRHPQQPPQETSGPNRAAGRV